MQTIIEGTETVRADCTGCGKSRRIVKRIERWIIARNRTRVVRAFHYCAPCAPKES